MTLADLLKLVPKRPWKIDAPAFGVVVDADGVVVAITGGGPDSDAAIRAKSRLIVLAANNFEELMRLAGLIQLLGDGRGQLTHVAATAAALLRTIKAEVEKGD